jgi:hypothetical protein
MMTLRYAERNVAATKAVIAVLIVASAVAWPASSGAQAVASTESPMAELEKAFWVCDHAATTRLIDSSTAITCGSVTEALKQRKFEGDFNALLAWWRQHKEAQHLALAKTGRDTP